MGHYGPVLRVPQSPRFLHERCDFPVRVIRVIMVTRVVRVVRVIRVIRVVRVVRVIKGIRLSSKGGVRHF
jgi:hypothetical protein